MYDHRETQLQRREMYKVLLESKKEASAQLLLTNKSNEPNKKNLKLENPADSKDLKEQSKDKSQSSKKKESNAAAQKQKKSPSEEKTKNQQ